MNSNLTAALAPAASSPRGLRISAWAVVALLGFVTCGELRAQEPEATESTEPATEATAEPATEPAPAAEPQAAPEEEADPVEITRVAIEQWVETRRVIAKEKRDWALGQEMLNDRIRIVSNEIDKLEGRITEAEKSITDADKKKVDLDAENERLKEAAASLDETVLALEKGTLALLVRLPDPIRERVKPLSQRIPDPNVKEGEQKKTVREQSLGARFQNIVGVLNEIDKFNREITMTSEVRTLADGSTAEVTALYVGIGQGYYVSANGEAAGVGSSSADGWVWTPANESAAEIAKAIAILKNEQIAEFVRLPISVK